MRVKEKVIKHFNEIYFRTSVIKDWNVKNLLTADFHQQSFIETREDDPMVIGFKILTHLMDKL